jgi:hypothetical protein
MATTDLTTSSAVRAVLGVSEQELPDDVLQEPIYTTLLTEDLRAIHPQIIADFATVAVIEVKTDDQERFFDLVQMYSAYHIAKRCLGAVGMFAPGIIKDARSELQRTGDPYKQLRADILATLPTLKVRMRGAYARINPAAVAPTPAERLRVLVATPVSPITGV